MNLVLLLSVAVQDLDVQAILDMQVCTYFFFSLFDTYRHSSVKGCVPDLTVLEDLTFALLTLRNFPASTHYQNVFSIGYYMIFSKSKLL